MEIICITYYRLKKLEDMLKTDTWFIQKKLI